MELQIINPEDYQLEPTSVALVESDFKTKENKLQLLQGSYNLLVSQSITNEDGSINEVVLDSAKETYKIALELEKEIDTTHKLHKEVHLRSGQYVDAKKNVLINIVRQIKKDAKKLVDYEKIQLQLEQERVFNERITKLNEIGYTGDTEQFKTLDNDTFEIFLKAKKADFEKAEQERLNEVAYNNGVAELYKLDLDSIKVYKSDNAKLMELAKTRLSELLEQNYNVQYQSVVSNGTYDSVNLTDEQITALNTIIEQQKEQALNEQFNKELHVINNTTDINYIIQYKGSRLEELQQALNSRLVALDEIRINHVKSNINATITNVRNDIDAGKIVDFSRVTLDAQEFTEVWLAELEKLKTRQENVQSKIKARNNEISILCSQLPIGVVVNNDIITSSFTSYGNFKDITLEILNHIKLDHAKNEQDELAKQGDAAVIKAWIDSFSLSECSVDNDKTKEIVKRFNQFKEWASKL